MALPASALTTLATVLDELGLATDGGVQDARLERYIRAASAFVARKCSRAFERVDGIVEDRAGFGLTRLYLDRTPILTVTTLKVNDVALAVTDYELRNAGDERSHLFRSSGWVWSAARYPGITQSPAPGQEKRAIEVTYSGGYVTPQQVVLGAFATRTLPDDLEDAVIELVTMRWRRRGTSTQKRQEAGQNASWAFGGDPVPPEIRDVIEGYARIVHG